VSDGYRSIVATWPNSTRAEWGKRANAYEDEGLDWKEAELKAFSEIKAGLDAYIAKNPAALIPGSSKYIPFRNISRYDKDPGWDDDECFYFDANWKMQIELDELGRQVKKKKEPKKRIKPSKKHDPRVRGFF
jgi:hypothetical protein